MPRRPKNVSTEDKEATVKLAQCISAVVLKALRTRGMTQAALASETGYAKSTLNQILNPFVADRKWNLKTLVTVARVLDLRVSELIQQAEKWDINTKDEDSLRLSIMTIGTDPKSPDRLQQIINEVSSDLHGDDVALFEIGCPAFYKAYIKGNLTDIEAFDKMKEAAAAGETTASGTPLPIWAILAKTYK